MAKGRGRNKADGTAQAKLQAYHEYLTTTKTLDEIGQKFKVCRQTIGNWLKEVREMIDEPALIEAARKDLIDLTSHAVRYYSRAVKREKVDMVGLIAATNTLKKQKLLVEEQSTTNINVNVITEQREKNLETTLNRFGLKSDRFITNGQPVTSNN